MHIVVVTRHLARAAFYYGPMLRALADTETQVTLVGPNGTGASFAECRGLILRETALRPFGSKPAPLEWAVLVGDLHGLLQEQPSPSGTIDVLMSLEEDLEQAVVTAARAVRARLVVAAAESAPQLRVLDRVTAHTTPLLSRLKEALANVVPDAAKQPVDALTQLPIGDIGRQALEPWMQQLPATLREGLVSASSSVVHASSQLRHYLDPSPVHYLLTEEPRGKSVPAGWTSFPLGVGLDVERFLVEGQGRTWKSVESSVPRVGFFCDPFADSLRRQTALQETRKAVDALTADDALKWVEMPTLPDMPGASLEAWARTYLQALDIVVVPGNDLYAAMQAAAAGCAVLTRADAPAAQTIRAGESGLELAALDAVQIRMALQSLLRGEQLHRMQDAAQRRATRLFGYELLTRRLARSMDDHLQLETADEGPSRIVRRHI